MQPAENSCNLVLLFNSYSCDVRIYTLIPVKKAFHIHSITNLQILYGLIYFRCIIAKIGFYGKGIGLSIVGYLEIKIIPITA